MTERPTYLTERRIAIMRFLSVYHRDHGYPPSVREIGAAVGLSSTSSVQAQLLTLERMGLLRRQGSQARALRWTPVEV